MATSKDFEKLWNRYQDEVQSTGKSIVAYCQENGIVYAQFERWFKKRGSSADKLPVLVPVEVTFIAIPTMVTLLFSCQRTVWYQR